MDDPERDRQAVRRELIRRINERWNAGQHEVSEEEADPECEIRSAMTGSVYRGYDGVRSWIREIDGQFDAWQIRLDEFVPANGERLLALGAIRFRGRGSGVELEVPVGWLYEFRGDKVLRLTTFATHHEGRQAAGLR